MKPSALLAAFTAALALCSLAVPASAQQYPSRLVTLVVPLAAGGPMDVVARLFAQKIAPAFGQSVIVENRPGAGGYIGGEYVARAAPDGHTLMVNVLEGVHTQLFTKDQPVVLSRELAAVALLAFAPNMYVGPASASFRDLKEFIAFAKANPKKVNVSFIPGNASALEVTAFLKAQGLDVLMVPYNAMAPVVTAMSRDEAHLYLGTVSSGKPLIEGGKVRGLAVFSDKRSPLVPEVPTLKELGLSYAIVDGINYSVFAPVRTPASILRIVNERTAGVMDNPEAREQLGKMGFFTGAPSVDELGAKFAAVTRGLERAAKDIGVVPQ